MSVSAAGGSCRLAGLQTAKINQESICQRLSVSVTNTTATAPLLLLLLHF